MRVICSGNQWVGNAEAIAFAERLDKRDTIFRLRTGFEAEKIQMLMDVEEEKQQAKVEEINE